MSEAAAQLRPSRVQIWVLASRPKTLAAAVAPVIVGTAMAYGNGGFAVLPAIAALWGAIWIQIGTNFANDYFDYASGADKGERLGPLRVTQAGLVSPMTMKRATALAFALALAAGVYLVWRGGWPIVAIGVCSILFGILYTGGPYPLGYHGWADLFVLVFFGPVAVAGTYYVQALQFDWQPVIAGIAPGLFSVAILTVNNLRDIDTDRTAGKKTLPARFGRTFARMEYVICVVVGSTVPLFLRLAFDSPGWSLLTLVVPVLAVPAIHDVFTKSGWVLNSTLATTGQLLLIYSILFSVGWLL